MSSEVVRQILQGIEDQINSRPSATEFEMAYQARVAVDRIRLAIKNIEKCARSADASHEAGLQLVDALQRLESIDHRFQERSRNCPPLDTNQLGRARSVVESLKGQAQ